MLIENLIFFRHSFETHSGVNMLSIVLMLICISREIFRFLCVWFYNVCLFYINEIM